MNTTTSPMEINIKQEFRDLIPPLSKEELDGLEKNILANGCEQPIKLWQGYIVDGHNRYQICSKHSLTFKTEELARENENQVILWIIDHQLDRRNISLYSRGRLINRKRTELSKGQGYRSDVHDQQLDQNSGQDNEDPMATRTDRKLAKESGISHDTLSRIAKIEEKATPEQKKALEKNEISINEVFTKISKEEKREARQEKLQGMAFPEGKYRVIYADPPWEYGPSKGPGGGDAEDQYPTMSFDSICELPVSQIADETAVLFLWVTTPLIQKGLDVMKAWGFEYKTLFTWDKVRSFFGHYNAVAQEFLLLGTKGSCFF